MTERLTKRNGVWHFARRVPAEFAGVDPRGVVKLSTKIKVASDRSGLRASRVAQRLDLDLEASWRAKVHGDPAQAALDFDAARMRARALGLEYVAIDKLSTAPAAELMQHVDALAIGHRRHDGNVVAAALGGVAPPQIRLSSLFAEFEITMATVTASFSPDQLRKWRAAKMRAIELLIDCVGDKVITALTRDDALKFSDFWQERVLTDGVQVGTANKNITHITGMLRKVGRRHRLGLDPVFAGTRLEGGSEGVRKPFATEFITGRILAPGALDGLNAEARAVVHVMINTGARPSEIVNLRRNAIHLDAQIPHIAVWPDGRVLKTEWSRRELPLVGIALDAVRQFPDGFPRYHDNGGTLSAAVNKFFRENGLKPSDQHTLYSLRHSFKDRLREAETPDELTDELMGHNTGKPRYGDGHGLWLKLKYLEKVALLPEPASRFTVRAVS